MLQVIPAMPLHDVEQQERAADRPRLRARVSGASDDQVGGRHQVRDPVGEAKGADPGLPPGDRG